MVLKEKVRKAFFGEKKFCFLDRRDRKAFFGEKKFHLFSSIGIPRFFENQCFSSFFFFLDRLD